MPGSSRSVDLHCHSTLSTFYSFTTHTVDCCEMGALTQNHSRATWLMNPPGWNWFSSHHLRAHKLQPGALPNTAGFALIFI